MSEAWDNSHGPSRSWRSGPWRLELRDDELADLSWHDTPVLRSVRAVARDRDWNTAELVVDAVTESDGSLHLAVHTRRHGAPLRGSIRVEASADQVVVHLDLVGAESWLTNRTGLVVLHPPSVAGAPLRVTHADGGQEHTAFPRAISPHQPVKDIAELAWTSGGVAIEVRFSGDVFEMEDQRNWTDASFKTYSRPLELPFPYRLDAGERVTQQVDVRVRRSEDPAAVRKDDVLELAPSGIFPDIAVGAATAPDPAPAGLALLGRAVLVELDLATASWRAALRRATSGATPLDVRLVTDPGHPEVLAEAARMLAGLPVLRVAAFDPVLHVSDAATVSALRDTLAGAGVTAPVVGGARSHFTELNRERHRLPDDLDGVVFAVTPLFHSTSTEQLVESVAMQRLVAQQAVGLAGGAPVHVGPVTLRPRFNDVATSAPAGAQHPDLSSGYGPALLDADDPRQDAPELAAWTVASAAALAVPGVASIAYFEEWGPRGVRDQAGTDRPVASALRDLASLSGRRMLWATSPDGLVWAVGGVDGSGATVLVASLDVRPRTVTVRLAHDARTVDLAPTRVARADLG